MKYYLWVKQSGGCDYTLACGVALYDISELAVEGDIPTDRIVTFLKEKGWTADGDITLTYARVLRVTEVRELDLPAMWHGLLEEAHIERLAAQRRRDEELYEILKRKLGRE